MRIWTTYLRPYRTSCSLSILAACTLLAAHGYFVSIHNLKQNSNAIHSDPLQFAQSPLGAVRAQTKRFSIERPTTEGIRPYALCHQRVLGVGRDRPPIPHCRVTMLSAEHRADCVIEGGDTADMPPYCLSSLGHLLSTQVKRVELIYKQGKRTKENVARYSFRWPRGNAHHVHTLTYAMSKLRQRPSYCHADMVCERRHRFLAKLLAFVPVPACARAMALITDA